ncbi:phage late control D family protein [Aquamicrobium zhengzhouense]|uniref:Late control D family protein n=1 Tax=Aquamicrobium zhengzhouense TaxID=2781738 RepID=A0ABS0SBV1_9HYPH|nr:late control D family protein [Aquamicrobium zhengzhouense]MBI1620171.1 late control D family protein [Aquamicrobium zhengzhouense]
MSWKVAWKVFVEGRDVTSAMRPYLIDIEVQDKAGSVSDSCSLTFDDRDGQTLLPRDGAFVSVHLQGVLVFEGTVDSCRSSGSRGGGGILKIGAKGFDSRGKVKQPQNLHKDEATLGDFLNDAAKGAGLSEIHIDPDLANISRNYWAAEAESFLHLGQRLAREYHATFKIRGKTAVLVKRGKEQGLPTIQGKVGENVISWDIAPYTGRKVFTKAKVSWFDRDDASFKQEEIEFALNRELPEAENIIRSFAADEDQAKSIGEARKAEAEREGGEGSVELDLTVEAQAEGMFILTGARAGVDGSYRIESVRHKASRSGGSTTMLELKQPGSGVGRDDRKSSAKGAEEAGQGARTGAAASAVGSGGGTGFEGSPELPGQR